MCTWGLFSCQPPANSKEAQARDAVRKTRAQHGGSELEGIIQCFYVSTTSRRGWETDLKSYRVATPATKNLTLSSHFAHHDILSSTPIQQGKKKTEFPELTIREIIKQLQEIDILGRNQP